MKKPLLFIVLIYLSSCTQSVGTTDQAPTPSYCATVVPEIAECTTTTSYTGGITVTGNASFYRRGLDLNHTSGSGLTLGAKTATALPIKYAEVRILSGTTIVQCGTTDAAGALKAVDGSAPLKIPGTTGTTYTIEVLSRVHHSMGAPAFLAYTSVKKDICSNNLHSVSTTFSSSSPTVTLTAQAEESLSSAVNGGAFNIYNDILSAYEYLSSNTGGADLSCLNPKLEVFWQAGFNPSQYIYPTADPAGLDPLSFYLRGQNQLYINGGKLGNVTSADTDQFDDAVIIHELGHRVEDACGKMDSPGGTHYGLFRIDPRLAWSEGWGNFFGANVTKNKLASINPDISGSLPSGWLYYLDTVGYNDGTTQSGSNLIYLDLNRPGNNPEVYNVPNDLNYDKVDPIANPGEGHFREVSVARSLFKSTNVCSNCTGQNYFPKMWQAFTSMGSSSYPFRSSIRFYNRLKAVMTAPEIANIDNILNNDEAQQRDGNAAYTSGTAKTWVPYGVKLVLSATACPLEIHPHRDYFKTTNYLSDQRYSNHFYYLDRATLPSVSEINLVATYIAGTALDIDLILYKEGYSFPTETCLNQNSSGDCVTYVKKTSSPEFIRSDRSSGLVKRIDTLTSLSASIPYLLDIKAYTAGISVLDTTNYSYTLKTDSGAFLCPSNF